MHSEFRSSNIPKSVFERARSIALDQDVMPISPASRTKDDKVSFCAAGCVSYAALELLISKEEAEKLSSQLVESKSSLLLIDVFRRFGWDVTLCEKLIRSNDITPREVRQQWFIHLCNDLELNCNQITADLIDSRN